MSDYHHYDPSYGYPSGPSGGEGGDVASKKRRMDTSNNGDEDEKPGKESKGGASEFVKKLYRMLEDPQFSQIVSWGYAGDSFVVKDMNGFTRDILPLHFKHSNFASFVRQLNKYDFHKVKNPDEAATQTWEFKHPNFRADMKDSLEQIKRKTPAPRKSAPVPPTRAGPGGSIRPTGPSAIDPALSGGEYGSLQAQIDNLGRNFNNLHQHFTSLSHEHQIVTGQLANFQTNLVAQDQLMQNLVNYIVTLEGDLNTLKGQSESSGQHSTQAQKLISSYHELAQRSHEQITDYSRRASMSNGSLPQVPLPGPGFGQLEFNGGGAQGMGRGRDSNGGSRDGYGPGGGQGGQPPPQQSQQSQQAPSQQQSQPQGYGSGGGNTPVMTHPHNTGSTPSSGSGPGAKSVFAPGWAVPPRVLLVEDDSVCRKLSSKFLQVFGCNIDVAVDGVSAVNKMNMEKYDLVLMDINMPNMDGVSATSLIRQFDPNTPIISMTSNSGPNDIMTYFSHGMNDILPKPFTKDNLLGMLEKHLVHLKVMQQMAEIPRALGFTNSQIQDALALSVNEEGNVMNPFSSMGISDADYLQILNGVAMDKEGKRGLDVVREGEGDGGRARFIESGR